MGGRKEGRVERLVGKQLLLRQLPSCIRATSELGATICMYHM